jgi:hypothetical protein
MNYHHIYLEMQSGTLSEQKDREHTKLEKISPMDDSNINSANSSMTPSSLPSEAKSMNYSGHNEASDLA